MPSFRSLIGLFALVLVLTSCAQKDGGSTTEQAESSEGVVREDTEASSSAVEDAGGAGGRESAVKKTTPPPPSAGPVTIRVTSENWKFTPAVIRVKKGQKVTLALEGVSGTHGFSAPTLGINTALAPGVKTNVILPTDFAGTHSFFCSIPCGAGHKDMIGQIVIEE